MVVFAPHCRLKASDQVHALIRVTQLRDLFIGFQIIAKIGFDGWFWFKIIWFGLHQCGLDIRLDGILSRYIIWLCKRGGNFFLEGRDRFFRVVHEIHLNGGFI